MLLDRIAGVVQRRKVETSTETDELRRMAEAVRTELLDEATIRSMSVAMDATRISGSVDPDVSWDAPPASAPSLSNAGVVARPEMLAYSVQMRAYRENA